jgi:hypothetical protein
VAPPLLWDTPVTHVPPSPTDAELCDAIVGYLTRHPEAADTLDGIAAWWVPMQRIETEVAEVTKAVEVLIARGVLESVSVGAQQCYRLRHPAATTPRSGESPHESS